MMLKKQSKYWARVLTAAIISLGVVTVALFGIVNSSVAGADTTSPAFYLDLGGSASIGVQPTLVHPRGQATSNGYANDLVAHEAARGVSLQLTQLGCPGETTTAMFNGADRCYLTHDTQLADAVSFLLAHYNQQGIVTIDLGFNNLRLCVWHQAVDQSCINNQLAQVQQQLPTIIQDLKSAAGPGVSFVGVGHYDPFLVNSLFGPAGQLIATSSNHDIGRLNETLHDVYASASVPMAPVGDASESPDVDLVTVAGVGTVPDHVADACALTWMCQPAPYGPNIHPNDAGYAAIAAAIEDVLKAPW